MYCKMTGTEYIDCINDLSSKRGWRQLGVEEEGSDNYCALPIDG